MISISLKAGSSLLDFRIPLKENLKELEPFQLRALIQRAFSIGLSGISEDPRWIEECKKEFLKTRFKVINSIRREYKNHTYLSPRDFFKYYSHYNREIINTFNIKFTDVFS